MPPEDWPKGTYGRDGATVVAAWRVLDGPGDDTYTVAEEFKLSNGRTVRIPFA